MTTFVDNIPWIYNNYMSTFINNLFKNIKSAIKIKNISFIYVFILILMLLSQLFTYEDFILLIESYWLPGGKVFARLLSFLIVFSELFAIPFLLNMKLSAIIRNISISFSFVLPIIWLFLTTWTTFTINSLSNLGLLGSIVAIKPAFVWIIFSLGLVSLSWLSYYSKHKK